MIIWDNLKNLWDGIHRKVESLNPEVKKLIWGIVFFIIICLILTINLIPNKVSLEAGQVSKSSIIAPRTISFIDQEKTDELKEMAVKSASRVYEKDNEVNNKIEKEIRYLFDSIRQQRSQENETSKQIESLAEDEQIKISTSTLTAFMETDDKMLANLEKQAISLMDRQLENRISPEDLEQEKEDLNQEVMELDLQKQYRTALAEILLTHLQPNMFLDKEATQARQKEAVAQVEPVKRTVRQGEVIVRKGDVVTSEDIKVLEALGLQKAKINYFTIIGFVLLVLTLISLSAYYFKYYQSEFWQENNKLFLLELLTVIVVILAKIISVFQSSYMFYLVPVAVASVLITVLIDSGIAVIATIFLSFLVALIFDNAFAIALVSFVGGIVGIFSVAKVSQRSDLVKAGFNVSGALVLSIVGMTLIQPFNNWQDIARPVSMGVLNGVIVAILANGLLPYLENAFNLTSSVKLLELSNPSHPLLKQLLVEAPGTYHHSIIVGNLAESAADNIGADSLLTRVSAYYHDIGKLKRPYFFIENQFGGENPHNKVSANLSSLIIKSHVKDGVELARKYNLPEPIIDIIKQHHSTNLISFFYQQAQTEASKHEIEETDFSYDGPKPQSKEAAIMMLADITEAAIRSKQFDRSDHNRIEAIVRELIRDKLINNQLDESDLTLKELDIIADSFVNVLSGIYHHRMEYPENLLKEAKRADNSDKSENK